MLIEMGPRYSKCWRTMHTVMDAGDSRGVYREEQVAGGSGKVGS